MKKSLEDRVLNKIAFIPFHSCWEWLGHKTKTGYGQIGKGNKSDRSRKTLSAHRTVFEIYVGPIPKDKELDHTCKNRGCVNPRHLELVTHHENLLRSDGICTKNASKIACPKGHPYDSENTYLERTKKGVTRRCRRCAKTRTRAYYVRNIKNAHNYLDYQSARDVIAGEI